jgi:hypothetical protein
MTPAGSWGGRATRAAPFTLLLDLSKGTVRRLGGTVESLATGVNEAGLANGRYRHSWLTDRHWPGTPPSAVTDLNDGISEDAEAVFEVWGVNDDAW